MELRNFSIVGVILILAILPIISAQQENEIQVGNEIQVSGFDLEEIIGLIAGIISLILFVLTFMAYKRDGRTRFLFVSVAFLLFSIKSFLDSSALFMQEIEIFGPIAVVLELFVILFFFFGVVKKEG